MNRLFELQSHTCEGDADTIIDLEKLCWLKIEKKPREHYPHLIAHFVDGHEQHDIMVDPSHYHLVETYRAYLSGRNLNEKRQPSTSPISTTRTPPDAGHSASPVGPSLSH
jgi:hypothetical protein